jgi:hypothetical protein
MMTLVQGSLETAGPAGPEAHLACAGLDRGTNAKLGLDFSPKMYFR